MFTVFTVKISIVLQNRRITGLTSKLWQIVHWTYLFTFITLLPLLTFLTALPCKPIAALYSLEAIGQMADPANIKCLELGNIELAARILHAVTDWLLVPIPLIIIWQLQMPLGRKIRIMFVFCLGLTSSVATIARTALAYTENGNGNFCKCLATSKRPKNLSHTLCAISHYWVFSGRTEHG